MQHKKEWKRLFYKMYNCLAIARTQSASHEGGSVKSRERERGMGRFVGLGTFPDLFYMFKFK